MARYVAVCDLDTVRIADAKNLIEQAYAKKFGAGKYAELKTYGDYREMLQDKSIDAVCISTPDHWHAQPAMEAALAGKDIYLQKPASLTIKEGRQMADTVKRTGRIFQQGSQQRRNPISAMPASWFATAASARFSRSSLDCRWIPPATWSRKCPCRPT